MTAKKNITMNNTMSEEELDVKLQELENDLNEVESVGSGKEIDKHHNKVEKLEAQLAEMELQWKRALADYQNLVRQTQQERQEYVRFANSTLIAQWLPAIDSLAMAAQHLKDPGLDMVYKQFLNSLQESGVDEINPEEGAPFDAHAHEAFEIVHNNEKAPDTIAMVAQKGYKWHDGPVIRHAKVKVYQPSEK